jgi:hypothetical protein
MNLNWGFRRFGLRQASTDFQQHVRGWCLAMPRLKLGVADTSAILLPHGSREDRRYAYRDSLYRRFDPASDVAINEEGALIWTTAKNRLTDDLEALMLGRKEDETRSVIAQTPKQHHFQSPKKKRALFTFGVGTHGEYLNITRDSLHSYASAHRMDFFDTPWFTDDRPPSWWKLKTALQMFEAGYEELLWVDADCVAVDHSEDIFDGLPADCHFGVVIHRRKRFRWKRQIEFLPNCGLMALRPGCRAMFEHAYTRLECIHHPWWEQAAIMGMLENPPQAPSKFPDETVRTRNPWWQGVHELDFRFNAWPVDMRYRGSTVHVFRHAAGMTNRAEVLRRWTEEGCAVTVKG